ncbi:MAG: hypothetical protein HN742_02330 [Lentisphaerae bacterium]|nr:hypothetical protein [Lentisphaerota bacterium]MBT4818285.1 hypothetical protein [Lentisphaerota bacterium]MBT5612098.1 hypothetical protein [Lentisphaerota bacterium]MBT7060560.1 hypothetical protein [Lentisphaerota bacterium]MBT7840675.1 hypothetical protein [Lentisphaerota bacterium]
MHSTLSRYVGVCFLTLAPVLSLAQTRSDTMIAYAPDIVGVDRIFLVALRIPQNEPSVGITHPETMVLFDRTPLPANAALRKYYFRAIAATDKAEIVFAHATGKETVPLTIWSRDDLRDYRKLKGIQLPRRWPLGEALPELKEGQTTTTAQIKESRKGRGKGNQAYLAIADDLIWSLQPDSTIPRWHWTNVSAGCPTHGKEIYKGRAFYPWLNETERDLRSYTAGVPYAWKIMCPVGKELYPSNDFANGDMTSGQFPDDGIGGACLHKGKKYGFVAEIAQAYCHQMLQVAPACADSYLVTGDMRYVHKALVGLSRLAVEYAYLATMTHHRHRNRRSQVDRLGQSRFAEGPFLSHTGFTVYAIDQPGYQWALAEAYDKIWPVIDEAPEIVPYLQSKGLDVETNEDVRRFIEENLFAVWMQGAMDGSTSSNEPYSQRGLARMAEVLNYKRGDEFMDWLYDGAGHMRTFVVNSFFRDGAPYESSGGYNGMHVVALGPIVESIEHLRELRPEVYPDDTYPNLSKSRRYHSVFDFPMNTVNIDRTYPRVGDDGGHPQYSKRGQRTWQNGGTAAFEHAYRIFRDPKFAWALANAPGWKPSLEFPFTKAEIEAEAATWNDTWNDGSCIQDGYGLAMLRSGEGTAKRALWMMYGRARGHTHDDIMHIGLDAFESEILGHLGYPRNWNHWTKNWITQIQARQVPFVNMTASAQIFADAGPVHLAEARAEAFTDRVASGEGYVVNKDNWQRRLLAIIDVDDTQFYCLDLYRIAGGNEMWWTFHAQEGEFSTNGLELTPQKEGTVAGPDVPYGDEAWLKKAGCRKGGYGWSGANFGFPHLYNVERARSRGGWSADWALEKADGLHFRLTVPETSETEVVVCDGTSPAGGKPYEMKWVLMHRNGDAPLQTQIATLMELYRESPVVRSVTPLKLSGPDEAGFNAIAFTVDLGHRKDTIFAAADASVSRTAPDGFAFSGRFGFYSEENGEPTNVVLVGGTAMTKNGHGVTQETAESTTRITAVDRQAGTVTITPAPPNPGALVGRIVFVQNNRRRLGIKVLAATPAGADAVLQLELDSCVGIGQVQGVAADRVLTETKFHLRGYRYYDGARLVSESGTTEYRVAGVRSTQFVLIDTREHADLDAALLRAEFPEGSWFEIHDYGVGDQLSWPNIAVLSRR